MVLLIGAGASARIVTGRHEKPIKQEPYVNPVQPPLSIDQKKSIHQNIIVEPDLQTKELVTPAINDQDQSLHTCQPSNLFATSGSTELKRLAPYEKALCNGSFSTSIIYVKAPATNDEADTLAATITADLLAYEDAHISPYIIVTTSSNDEKTGSVFEYFLSVLKAKGITDAQAGTWVFFPAPNAPDNSYDPAFFAASYTSYAALFREYFTAGQLGVLFNASNSAEAYLSALPSGLVTSVGYRGIPMSDPGVMLKQQGVSSLWFNLAFPDGSTDSITRLTELKLSGFHLVVNIQANDDALRADSKLFTAFTESLQEQSISFGMY